MFNPDTVGLDCICTLLRAVSAEGTGRRVLMQRLGKANVALSNSAWSIYIYLLWEEGDATNTSQ